MIPTACVLLRGWALWRKIFTGMAWTIVGAAAGTLLIAIFVAIHAGGIRMINSSAHVADTQRAIDLLRQEVHRLEAEAERRICVPAERGGR